jgi:hypothetical protein
MVISPSGEMRILSRPEGKLALHFFNNVLPRGPRDVRRIPDTVRAAKICDLIASIPWSLQSQHQSPCRAFQVSVMAS